MGKQGKSNMLPSIHQKTAEAVNHLNVDLSPGSATARK
jgi:hypothetical protein